MSEAKNESSANGATSNDLLGSEQEDWFNPLIARLHKVSPDGHATDISQACWMGFHFGVPVDVIRRDLAAYVERKELEPNTSLTGGA